MTEPVSLPLSQEVDQFVSREAKRIKRPKSWLLQTMLDEAVRMRLFPGIAFGGSDSSRRAWVMGTASDVWEIVAGYRDFGSERAMAEALSLTEAQIRLALAYYARFPEEIDEAIGENTRPLDELQEALPAARVSRVE